jgi:steroid 5-alpha reductase family enzyme
VRPPYLRGLIFRNYLIMLIGSYRPLGYEDLIVGTLLLICIGTETLADEQQWIYQNAKKASPSKSTRSHSREAHPTSYCQPEDLSRGFIAGGLWRYSRHPNFACEQAIWGLFYAWGCVATVFASRGIRELNLIIAHSFELDCKRGVKFGLWNLHGTSATCMHQRAHHI